ncbi:universal stress protein [Nostocoides sp. HKS02]|uniref:universal stress protein n=1 Tax=Nostocoides sp. HKS02 TaxID=1813880 RepID=UPI0012B4E880|nr:universal stress protein [Tetrasphaera sp. HKS02]QGN57318.1 universal stress protein [Tetrasphaera sp. HKS02]
MTILAGYAPEKRDVSAIALAAALARPSGEEVLVVSVVPSAWTIPTIGGSDREFARWSRQRGAKAVAEATMAIEDICPDLDATVVMVDGRSVPGALLSEASRVGASVIAVGSGQGGSWGRVVLNSTADRLLHSSTVPVAVASRGYRSGSSDSGAASDSSGVTSGISRVSFAFRGDPPSVRALAATADFAARLGARLRVVTFGVRGRTMHPPRVSAAEDMVLAEFIARSESAQADAVASLGDAAAPVEDRVVAVGRDWAQALDRAGWQAGDLLVVGSSEAGLMTRVFLGSSATRIVRHSPVPVVVVP